MKERSIVIARLKMADDIRLDNDTSILNKRSDSRSDANCDCSLLVAASTTSHQTNGSLHWTRRSCICSNGMQSGFQPPIGSGCRTQSGDGWHFNAISSETLMQSILQLNECQRRIRSDWWGDGGGPRGHMVDPVIRLGSSIMHHFDLFIGCDRVTWSPRLLQSVVTIATYPQQTATCLHSQGPFSFSRLNGNPISGSATFHLRVAEPCAASARAQLASAALTLAALCYH